MRQVRRNWAQSVLLAVLAAAPGVLSAIDGELTARLDALGRESYSMSPAQTLEALREIAPRAPTEPPDARALYLLLEARSLALRGNSGASLDTLAPLIGPDPVALPVRYRLRALNLAANVLIEDDRYEEGFDYFRRALELAPGVRVAWARADTWNLAGLFFNRIGEHATALEYVGRALDAVTDDPEQRQHCIGRLWRADALSGLGRLPEALAAYRAAAEHCARVPDRVFTGSAWLGTAQTLQATDAASGTVRDALNAALAQFQAVGDHEGMLEAGTALAELLLDQSEPDLATRAMAAAPSPDLPAASLGVRAAAHSTLARLARIDGRDREAFEHARQAIELEHRLEERNREMRIGLLLSDRRNQAHENEFLLLQADQRLDSLDTAGKRHRLTSGTLLGGAALAGGGLLLALLLTVTRDRNRLRRRMRSDALTGLLNHTGFFESADEAFRRARQRSYPFTLIVADIDLFKQINDEHGHLAGDAVLQRVAARLTDAMGENALLGRVGGEEFGIALAGADVDQAVAHIERFRAALNQDRGDSPHVSLSFGVAELGRESSLDVLYAHADQALYDAKETGRNRVVTVARIQLGSGAFVT